MPEQRVDVSFFVGFAARNHAHQGPHLLLQMIPVQNQRHRLTEDPLQLAADGARTIADRYDWERCTTPAVVCHDILLHLLRPAEGLCSPSVNPSRQIHKTAAWAFH